MSSIMTIRSSEECLQILEVCQQLLGRPAIIVFGREFVVYLVIAEGTTSYQERLFCRLQQNTPRFK